MKKTFTILTAALMLLAMFANPMRVWGEDVTDVLNKGDFAATGTSYTTFSNVQKNTAVYAGRSSVQNSSVGMKRDNTNGAGIFTTTSGGVAKSLTFTWTSTSNRTLQVYGKNSAYSLDDTKNTNNYGTLIASATYDSGNLTPTLTLNGTDEYEYILIIPSSTSMLSIKDITITWTTSGGGGATATTTTISASGITHTDVYAGTAAGSLSATVSAGGSAISGATVTWSGNNNAVATIDATTGAVTLVAAGSVTFTASYAGVSGQYQASSATYVMTVTDSTPFTGDYFIFNTDEGLEDLNITIPSASAGTDLDANHDYVMGNVTMNVTHANTATRVWGLSGGGTELRAYTNSTLTFSVPSGYAITKVTFTGSALNYSDLNNGVWTASESVRTKTFTCTATAKVNTIAVEYEDNASVVDPPTLPASVNFLNSMSVAITNNAQGATIYYTTDDADPKTSSTRVQYTQAFTVSATTTIKAVAYVNPNYSPVVEATYTLVQALNTIQAVFDAATDTEIKAFVNFNNYVVSGVSTNGKNVFVTDNNGRGFVIFNNNGGLDQIYSVDDILSGTAIACDLVKYHGFAELTNVDANDLTITAGGTVSTSNIALANLAGVNTGTLVHYENLECSVSTSNNNTLYHLSDGTTSIQVYNSLYAFNALEGGKYYDITGIYQQLNDSKEILPRSIDDIEEVTTPPTITASDVNIAYNATSGSITYTIGNVPNPAGILTAVSSDNWLKIGTIGANIPLSCTANSLATARTATVTLTYTYGNNRTVTKTVTVTQATNTTQGGWVLTSLSELTEDDIFVIVGSNSNTYAMSNNNGTTNPPAAVAVTVSNGALSAEPADNIKWNLSGNATDGYTFYPNGTTESWLYCTNTNNGVRVGDNPNKVFVLDSESGYLKHNGTSRYLGIYNSQDWRCYTSSGGNIASQTFAFYKKVDAPVIPSYTLTINQYTTDENGWNLIASPIASEIPASSVNNLVSNTYDLYYFDPSQTKQWVNYKNDAGNANPGFSLVAGKGYLYANSAQVTLTFTGTLNPTSTVTLAYDGWNLIGNSSNETRYVSGDYYIMNSTNSGIIASERTGGYVNAMEGIFVEGEEGDEITFSTGTKRDNNSQVVLNVSNNDNVIDRAIVRFNSDRQLGKLTLFDNDTKIYIPQNDDDYAIVSSNGQGTMPVNFKAKEMGMYTISVETEGIDLSYLHLIDRLTGEDVNLLLDNKYSFIASNSDTESRFILSFNENGINANNDTFAFQNGSDIIVNGEGELQIFDVMGRNIMNTMINGVQTVNVKSNGVYIFKLNEKTQKIIVR